MAKSISAKTRDDSILYTGRTSSTPFKPLKEKKNEEKVEQQRAITPAAKVIWDIIESEKESITNLKSFILEGRTEESLKDEMNARKLYYDYLNRLQLRIKAIMEAKPRKKDE